MKTKILMILRSQTYHFLQFLHTKEGPILLIIPIIHKYTGFLMVALVSGI